MTPSVVREPLDVRVGEPAAQRFDDERDLVVAPTFSHRHRFVTRCFGLTEPLIERGLREPAVGSLVVEHAESHRAEQRVEAIDGVVTGRPDPCIRLRLHGFELRGRYRRLEPEVLGRREVPIRGRDRDERAVGGLRDRRGLALAHELGRGLEQGGAGAGLLVHPARICARSFLT